jgi:hypothetical protein
MNRLATNFWSTNQILSQNRPEKVIEIVATFVRRNFLVPAYQGKVIYHQSKVTSKAEYREHQHINLS